MKIIINQDKNASETEITVKCCKVDADILEILSYISLAGNSIAGKLGDEICIIELGDILYFESVNDRVFFYTEQNSYETQTKLYQFEERLSNTPMIRISKSVIANLKKLRSIKPEKNGRFTAMLVNGAGKTDALITAKFIFPLLVTLLICNFIMIFSWRIGSSLTETWIRRLICVTGTAFITPIIYIIFGTINGKIEPVRYFLICAAAIEIFTFIVYFIVDRVGTKAMIDKINDKLKQNK